LKANKVNLVLSSVLFVFWYNSPNVLDTPRKSMLAHTFFCDLKHVVHHTFINCSLHNGSVRRSCIFVHSYSISFKQCQSLQIQCFIQHWSPNNYIHF
jgi:hypothetical protein